MLDGGESVMHRRTKNTLHFTKQAIDKLAPTEGRERGYHYDLRTQGLAVCVTAAGSKTFYLLRRINGKMELESLAQILPAIKRTTVVRALEVLRPARAAAFWPRANGRLR